MSMIKTGLGAFTAAAIVVSAANPAVAANAALSPAQAQATKAPASGATDISAQRRYRGGGGAAAAAAFAGVVGTAIAVGAARNSYGDGYYAGGPAYYGSPYDSYNSYDGPYGGGSYGYSGYRRDVAPGYQWDNPSNHNVNR